MEAEQSSPSSMREIDTENIPLSIPVKNIDIPYVTQEKDVERVTVNLLSNNSTENHNDVFLKGLHLMYKMHKMMDVLQKNANNNSKTALAEARMPSHKNVNLIVYIAMIVLIVIFLLLMLLAMKAWTKHKCRTYSGASVKSQKYGPNTISNGLPEGDTRSRMEFKYACLKCLLQNMSEEEECLHQEIHTLVETRERNRHSLIPLLSLEGTKFIRSLIVNENVDKAQVGIKNKEWNFKGD